jgi:hypothetical protein
LPGGWQRNWRSRGPGNGSPPVPTVRGDPDDPAGRYLGAAPSDNLRPQPCRFASPWAKARRAPPGPGTGVNGCLSLYRSQGSLLPHCPDAHGRQSSNVDCYSHAGTVPITTVIFLALASMFGFGAGFVLTQFGLRWMQPWLGVAFSIPTSTLLFGVSPHFSWTRATAI